MFKKISAFEALQKLVTMGKELGIDNNNVLLLKETDKVSESSQLQYDSNGRVFQRYTLSFYNDGPRDIISGVNYDPNWRSTAFIREYHTTEELRSVYAAANDYIENSGNSPEYTTKSYLGVELKNGSLLTNRKEKTLV